MTRLTPIRTASLVALLALPALGMIGPATASDPRTQTIRVVGSDQASKFIPLGIGKSVVIDLPRDIKDVLVAEPKFANAVVRSARRAYIIGVAAGQTNVFFFDNLGNQIAGFDITVARDLSGVRAALRQALPTADIRIETVGDGNKVVNSISVSGRDQVMLKVTVAEVQRDIIKQLGVNLDGSLGYATAVVNFKTNNTFSAFGQTLSDSAVTGATLPLVTDPLSPTSSLPRFAATLRAMERAGVVRTLAEPNLTAISGESATFLAGGEFPIPGNYTCDPTTRSCQVQVQFKKFGVGLNFTPVVLAGGRISLKVMTEVSELSSENALTLTQSIGNGQTTTLTIPSIKTRRADTTVEIPSGGTLALAGLIHEQTKQHINGIPGLMQLPVLGALFKSRDFVNRQSELVVMITPFVVRAVAQKQLSRPDDGFADPSDPSAILLGRLNRLYGTPSKVDQKQVYHGKYGFILD